MFIPTYGSLFLIRFFVMITRYTVLDEQRREAKEENSQRQNPRSITRGATTRRPGVRSPMGTVYLPSSTSFARDSK